MLITIEQKKLVAALEAIKSATSRRSTLPILANVMIGAREGEVIFSACNLEVYADYTVACDVSEIGSITVNHKDLLALVKPLSGETIKLLSWTGTKITIESESIHTVLEAMDANEFPEGPRRRIGPVGSTWEVLGIGGRTVKGVVLEHCKEEVRLLVQDFHHALTLVGYGAATDDSRPVLTGLQMEVQDGLLRLVTGDAFRLCLQEIPVAGSWSKPALPSAKAVIDTFKKFPKRGDLFITVENAKSKYVNAAEEVYSGPFIFFRCGSLEVTMRLIEGTFPNWKSIIPKPGKTLATLPAASLQRALNAVKTIAVDASNITRLHLNSNITVKAQRDGMDEPMVVEVAAETSGEDLEVIYNWQYLYDVLAASPKSQATLRITEPTAPTTLELSDEPRFLAMIMPMHINQ